MDITAAKKYGRLARSGGRVIALLFIFTSAAHGQNPASLLDSAANLLNLGHCDSAQSLLETVSRESRQDDTVRAETLFLQGRLCVCRKNYRAADSLYVLSQDLYAAARGGGSENVRRVFNSRLFIYYWTAQLDRSLALTDSFLTANEKEPLSAAYAETLYRRAEALYHTGRLGESESAFIKALTAIAETETLVSGSYINCSYLLANFYTEQGRYEKAREVLLRAIAPNKSIHIFMLKTQLGELHQGLGQFREAEAVYLEVLEDLARAGLDQSNEAITTLRDLAVLYEQTGRLNEAEKYLELARSIHENSKSHIPIEEARSLRNLSSIRQKQGRLREADSLCALALTLMRTKFEDSHYLSVRTLARIGVLRHLQGRSGEAVTFLERAAAFSRSPDFPDVLRRPNYLFHLGDSYRALGRNADAARVILEALQLRTNILKMIFPSLNEREKRIFYNTIRGSYEYLNSFVMDMQGSSPGLIGAMYDNLLATKSVVFKYTKNLTEQIRSTGDTALLSDYDAWLRMKNRIARLHHLASDMRELRELDSLSKAAGDTERRLTAASADFAEAYRNREASWRDVRSRLQKNEAAVEIVRFHTYVNGRTDSVCYAALIVDRHAVNQPRLVLIPGGRYLETDAFREYMLAVSADFDGSDTLPRLPASQRRALLKKLYRLYWAPVQAELRGARTVWLSADGVYHRLNLDPLQASDTKTLFDLLDLRLITSTRDIGAGQNNGQKTVPPRGALLLGAPAADTPTLPPRNKNGFVHRNNTLTASDLQSAREEILQIERLMQKHGWSPRALLGDSAREIEVTSIRETPGILHFATHGIFKMDTSEAADLFELRPAAERSLISPYLNSGLLLASPPETARNIDPAEEDGLLTAYEVLHSRLTGAELAVLSACGSGKGIIYDGEGVQGLQRAFILAGVRRVMMSLWNVDDAITREFMTLFYSRALIGRDYRRAYRKAVAELRKTKPYLLPCDWAGFVMVE